MKNKLLLITALLISGTIACFAQPLTANAGSDQSICAGSGTSLNGSGQFGMGSYTYSWSPAGGLSSTNVANPTCIPAITTTYILTITDSVFSTATDTVIITVNPLPTVTATSATVCAGGTANLAASGAVTYMWSPGGQNTSSISVTPSSTTVYTVTGTSVSGCTGTATSTVTVMAGPSATVNGTNVLCAGGANGMATATASGGAGAYSYFWTPISQSSPTVNGLVAGNYTVTVTDANGCTGTNTVTINEPSPINVNAGPDQAVCAGDSVTFISNVSGGTMPYMYSWSNSATTSNITAVLAGGYTLAITDVNGCTSNDVVNLLNNPNTDIIGQVVYSGGSITNGNAFLIKQGAASSLFDTVATSVISGSGTFNFTAVPIGSYYIRAEANSANYPLVINTYFGNVYLWDSAFVLNHGCAAGDTANITMIELPVLSGPGIISGTVVQGAGFGQKIIPGNPTPYANVIPGVPVKVGKNPSGNIVASGITDTSGVYTFTNLPIDNYIIYVDIPGYPMDSSYVVSITSSNPTATNLDYIVDSNAVFVDLTLSAQTIQAATAVSYFHTFPNPAQDNATVVFDVTVNSNVNFELYNLQGEKIATLLNRNFEKGKYAQSVNFDQYGITSGTYMIKAVVNNTQHIISLVIMK